MVAVKETKHESPHIAKSNKEAIKELLDKFIKEETRMVKGRFRCYETPGAIEKIIVRKYPGIPMFEKWMTDGEMYEIPLYAARFLNGVDVTAKGANGRIGTCSYGVHGFKWDKTQSEAPRSHLGFGASGEPGIAVPIVGIVKTVRRYGFESLEFDSNFDS